MRTDIMLQIKNLGHSYGKFKVIEDISGVPVSIKSVGPGRDETIIVKYPS